MPSSSRSRNADSPPTIRRLHPGSPSPTFAHSSRRPDPARHAVEDPTAIQPTPGPKSLLTTHERQDAVVVPENSADLGLLKPDRPLTYTSKTPEETCGVTDKVP